MHTFGGVHAVAAALATWNGWKKPFQFTVWGALFWVNLIVVVGLVVTLVITLRRDRVEKIAANLVPFLDDDDLEGPRLERVLGWALFFLAVLALAYPLYWLRETAREKASVKYFSTNSVVRGETLFSNAAMPKTFDSAKSLQCANCHGVAGSGGSGAPYTYTDPATGKAYGPLTWKAPALNTVLYRFSPQEVHDIIEYGRPGTPMQPWGVLGGGPKNEQSIGDLVAYVESIQLPPGTPQEAAQDVQSCRKGKLPKTALGQTSCALDAARTQADTQLSDANQALSAALAQKQTDVKDYADKQCATTKPKPGDPNAVDCAKLSLEINTYTDPATPVDPKALDAAHSEIAAAQKEPKGPQRDSDMTTAKFDLNNSTKQLAADNKAWVDKHCNTPQESAVDDGACQNLDRALHSVKIQASDDAAIDTARSNVTWAKDWQQRRKGVTDGQLLFETNCARCHTQNWSIFDPTNAQLKPENLLGVPGGNGSLGYNLRDNGELRRFPNTRDPSGNLIPHSGILSQIQFVANGSDANIAYGKGGIGSGRMPGQCNTAVKADTTVSLPYYGCMLTEASNTDTSTYVPNADSSAPVDNAMIDEIVQYERCGLDLTKSDLTPPLDYASGCN